MTIRMAPLIILLIMQCIGLGIIWTKHGEERKDKYNGWISIIAIIIEWGLILWAIL